MDEKSAGQDEPKEESNLGGEDYVGGTEFSAIFTAYYPGPGIEGGDTDCREKKLNPSKRHVLHLWLELMKNLIIQKSSYQNTHYLNMVMK